MLPRLALDNAADQPLRVVKVVRNPSDALTRGSAAPDFQNHVAGYSRPTVVLACAAFRMLLMPQYALGVTAVRDCVIFVLPISTVFQVPGSIVSLICVLMVNHLSAWTWSVKCCRNQLMNTKPSSLTMCAQMNTKVAIFIWMLFSCRSRDPHTDWSRSGRIATHVAQVRNRVIPLVTNYIAPFFRRQFFFGKLLLSHCGFSLHENASWIRAAQRFALLSGLLCIVAFPAQASLSSADRGVGGNTGASTLSVAPTSNYTANSFAVLCLAYDNAGSAGSALIAPASATDTIGNVWTLRQNALFDNGAASAGMEIAIYTSFVSSFPTSASLTITWSAGSPVARFALHEFTSTLGGVAYVTGGVGTGVAPSGGTTAAPSIVTSSITSGDAVIGVVGLEGTDTFTPDSDSTNGSWSTHQHSSTGSGTSAVTITSQRKVTTGTATQTYNVSNTSGDTQMGWISITETSLGMGRRIIRM